MENLNLGFHVKVFNNCFVEDIELKIRNVEDASLLNGHNCLAVGFNGFIYGQSTDFPQKDKILVKY